MSGTKYIFVTGGVVSSLGKGITAASLGRLLKSRGYSVTIQKCDPYINVDPGTMNPYQHGEVFVTADGAETDLDLGHYERFIDEELGKNNNVTSGGIYWSVINKERKGNYLGATVQVIPHITNEIKDKIKAVARDKRYDFVICEIGGTVGDIEGLPFLEAIRQFKLEVGRNRAINIHVTLVPYLQTSGEYKTKPTQHSVKALLSLGIQPDVIVCRSTKPVSMVLKKKISLFCNVETRAVVDMCDAESIYDVPMHVKREQLDETVLDYFGMDYGKQDLFVWEDFLAKKQACDKKKKIGIVGKYVELSDAYISVVEAVNHAAIENGIIPQIAWINSEKKEGDDLIKAVKRCDAVIVPGGFGVRGIEGKIQAITYVRKNNIPYLGLCLGMQCAVVEFARTVLKLPKAHSTEFVKEPKNPVIDLMIEQKQINKMGGTMRLGNYDCRAEKGTLLAKLYGKSVFKERHRHRYEFNNAYMKEFKKAGMALSGINPDRNLVEVVEIPAHKYFVASQFHPEFKSRPGKPHPLFDGLLKSLIG
ncbi:CTP synthase [Candidatus Margulisiibacteriota bacterium]